jgi:hypothetical protein
VAKLSGTGTLDYATYLGGWHADYAGRIAVDSDGRAHVTGVTWSMNFPVVSAHQATIGGGYSDVFVAALNQSGNGFVYSTYLGGNAMENDSTQSMGPDIAVTPAGDAYVTGMTMSPNFPVTPDAFQASRAGGATDGFVTKFDAAGVLQYSTFIGGSGSDYPRAIAVDSTETAIIVGYTDSTDLPVRNAFQPTYSGSEDGFVAKIAAGNPPPDTTAPRTTISLDGTSGLAGWYRSPMQVTLTAVDDPEGRGVRLVEYSVNGQPFLQYSGPFTIAAQGTTQIAARATDNAGNQEAPAQVAMIRIDLVGPAIDITSPESRDYLHSDTLTFAFSASDQTSGMSSGPSATLDGAVTAAQSINLLALSLGSHVVTVSGSDAAGNSSLGSVTFRIVATIDSLIAATNIYSANGSIDNTTYRNLIAKLNDAKNAYARGNLTAARGKLRDFIDQCTAVSGKGVSPAAATVLVADARWVLGTI